jgi:hypothetical protein
MESETLALAHQKASRHIIWKTCKNLSFLETRFFAAGFFALLRSQRDGFATPHPEPLALGRCGFAIACSLRWAPAGSSR